MTPFNEDPATLAACGAPKSDLRLAGTSIVSDYAPLIRNLQVRRLARCYALSFEMAARIVPFVFGEVVR
ncbi:hypothetical protein QIH87_43720 [Bradyrhizobium elkanii]|uniref:Uncharacterized protein n=1 Tax=Bradyrhizobium elkanii TaxID=29448 RepID=A0ABV4FH65_BRAEL|nr:hypothetical protein [Bradyrhizobium elkanii]MCP1979926.1 hypothetical protein [Bradyrhizobium elkanii]MCS3885297.1 hypothetical protein [Bradyrhizobium elkanii]MCS4215677.1 hypothetical protein [Bradyrhizobium elkanii]MCW2188734.1 hypothetical protein [Bradyrhizobium elkanii]